MKKILAVFMVIAITLAFASCSSKNYKDTVVTIPVTDENGEQVTDKDGKPVTEVVEAEEENQDEKANGTDKATQEADTTKKETEKSTTEKSEKTTEKSDKTTKKSDKTTTAKQSTAKKDQTTKADEATKKTDATEKTTKAQDDKTTEKTTESTTKKPEKREVKVRIILPYYNEIDSELSIKYKVEGDDEVKQLKFDDDKNPLKKKDYELVKLDGKTAKEYSLGKHTGSVKVKLALTGVSLTNNIIVIDPYSDSGEIIPTTGIEVMDGDMI